MHTDTATAPHDQLLTVADVAAALQLSEWTIRHWLAAGQLRGTRIGSARAGWRVKKTDLDAFVDAGMNQPT
jgi:excisionase family DNA binding protein